MATTSTAQGLSQELQRSGIGPGTVITPDNGKLLLEKNVIIAIANQISKITKAKLGTNEVTELVQFVRDTRPERFYKKSLTHAINEISKMFITKYDALLASRAKDGSDNIAKLAHYDEYTNEGTVADYLHEEVLQTSDSEHQYKVTAHSDRRGNAIIDRDRVQGFRSSPNSILPSQITSINDERFIKEIMNVLTPIGRTINPENMDEYFMRARSAIPGLQTFDNIVLPHRTIPLDSRHRMLSNPSTTEITWSLNPAGKPGQYGDIWLQDTLQQIIKMKIYPFWIPTNNPLYDYFTKIRMNIREIWQHIQVTEFLNPDQSLPTAYGYQFEFIITRREKTRIYLEPISNIYILSKPVARIETLTVEFRSPFQLITLDPDRGIFTATYSAAAGDPTLFTLTNGTSHFLNTGDLVYVINSDSGDTTIDDELNDQQGYIVTRINDTEFTIEVDTNSLAPGNQTGITVIYGSKRIVFQMEFTSLEH